MSLDISFSRVSRCLPNSSSGQCRSLMKDCRASNFQKRSSDVPEPLLQGSEDSISIHPSKTTHCFPGHFGKFLILHKRKPALNNPRFSRTCGNPEIVNVDWGKKGLEVQVKQRTAGTQGALLTPPPPHQEEKGRMDHNRPTAGKKQRKNVERCKFLSRTEAKSENTDFTTSYCVDADYRVSLLKMSVRIIISEYIYYIYEMYLLCLR